MFWGWGQGREGIILSHDSEELLDYPKLGGWGIVGEQITKINKEKSMSFWDDAKEKVGEAAGGIKEGVEKAGGAVKDGAEKVGDKAHDVMDGDKE